MDMIASGPAMSIATTTTGCTRGPTPTTRTHTTTTVGITATTMPITTATITITTTTTTRTITPAEVSAGWREGPRDDPAAFFCACACRTASDPLFRADIADCVTR